jgi:hypothetical protein
MVSIRKVVGVMSCGFLLCFGLAYAVWAENVGYRVSGNCR